MFCPRKAELVFRHVRDRGLPVGTFAEYVETL